MAVYDLPQSTVLTNLNQSVGGGLAARILEALNSQPGGQSSELTLLSGYKPGDVVPAGTDLVLMDPAASGNVGTLPNAPAVIFTGPAGVQIVLDGTLDQVVQMSSGADTVRLSANATSKFIDLGAGNDSFTGNNQGTSVVAGSGNNTLNMLGGDDAVDVTGGASVVDGGTGFDTAFVGGKKSDYNVTVENGVVKIVDKVTGLVSTTENVEFIKFGDGSVIVNVASQELAAIARIYEVALDRSADAAGMKFWTGQKELTAASTVDFANAFISSNEFTTKFGANSSMTNQKFLEVMYDNAFERAADPSGLQYWLTQMSAGMTRGEIVVRFAFEAEAQQTFDGSVNVINTLV
jgi:Ca2+-binding RTX toxin-like protein